MPAELPSLEAALATLAAVIRQRYHRRPDSIEIHFPDGKPYRLPAPDGPPAGPAAPAPPGDGDPFVPSPFQVAILEALEGKALRTDALGHKVDDRTRLFRHPGGLRELREHGLVGHHKRLGFYRPDCPPEELPAE